MVVHRGSRNNSRVAPVRLVKPASSTRLLAPAAFVRMLVQPSASLLAEPGGISAVTPIARSRGHFQLPGRGYCRRWHAALYCAARAAWPRRRAVSSAVEHYLDMVGVTSSILVPPTTFHDPSIEWGREGESDRVPLFRGRRRSALAPAAGVGRERFVLFCARFACCATACPGVCRAHLLRSARSRLAAGKCDVQRGDSACSNAFTDVDCSNSSSRLGRWRHRFAAKWRWVRAFQPSVGSAPRWGKRRH